MPLTILAISGSLRKASLNRKLLEIAKHIASDAGHTVTEADLKELALPIYDQDIQDQGFPESVTKFKTMIEAADVVLISSPEYNHSIPGGLKNAIDWASRDKNSFDGKVAAIFGVSDGPFGTVRMQPHLRQVLATLNVLTLPRPQVNIRMGKEAFNEDGSLKDPDTYTLLETLIKKTLEVASKLH